MSLRNSRGDSGSNDIIIRVLVDLLVSSKELIYKIFVKILLPFRVAMRFEVRREIGNLEKKLDMLRAEFSKIERRLRSQDLAVAVQEVARFDSAEYIIDHMVKARAFETQFSLMEFALGLIVVQDDSVILEFGVYEGNSINHISSLVNCEVFGFDCFSGLPEAWRTGFDTGKFALESLPKVNDNVTLVEGFFAETLPDFVKNFSGSVSLIHVDCDLYSSTVDIFKNLASLIKPGVVVVFDEYFNYPGWRQGEHKAFLEFVSQSGLKYEYMAYNSKHEQVVVRIH